MSTATEMFVLWFRGDPEKGRVLGSNKRGLERSPAGIHRSSAPSQKVEL